MTPEERINRLESQLAMLVASDRYIFRKDLQLLDGRNIQFASGTGTKIGTSALQKMGFFGASPVAQQAAISAPAGGATIDSQSRTAVISIINELHNLGLTA